MIQYLVKSRVHGEKYAYLDKLDYDKFHNIAWYIVKDKENFYLKAKIRVDNKLKVVFLHRYILGFPLYNIDHKDGNGLNNTRTNIRRATNAQNARNCRISSNNTSGFKGVTYYKQERKYAARIVVNRKIIMIGLFSNVLRAAERYNSMAIKKFGKFARINVFTKEQEMELLGLPMKDKRRPIGYKKLLL